MFEKHTAICAVGITAVSFLGTGRLLFVSKLGIAGVVQRIQFAVALPTTDTLGLVGAIRLPTCVDGGVDLTVGRTADSADSKLGAVGMAANVGSFIQFAVGFTATSADRQMLTIGLTAGMTMFTRMVTDVMVSLDVTTPLTVNAEPVDSFAGGRYRF